MLRAQNYNVRSAQKVPFLRPKIPGVGKGLIVPLFDTHSFSGKWGGTTLYLLSGVRSGVTPQIAPQILLKVDLNPLRLKTGVETVH